MPVISTLPISADLVASQPGPQPLRTARLESWARFEARELPTESEEIWRYSRIDELELDRYRPVPPGGELALGQLPPALRELIEVLGPSATVVLSHNGGPARLTGAQAGVTIEPSPGPLAGAQRGGLGGPPADIWSDLNGAVAPGPLRLTVAAGATVPAPVAVVHWLEGEGALVCPRLEIDLGPESDARVLEVVASDGSDLVAVPLVEMALARGARLGYGHVQLLGERAWQLGNQVSRSEQSSSLRSMTFSLGGSYARVRTDSVLVGPGAESQLLAAYFGSGSQMHDLRTVQHHAAPQCRSDLLFKGVVANQARSTYSGLIRVEKGAKGTNAFQTNRNLVLSEGAQAYSVPNLEIEDNDVRCSHASAVGPVDESQLFYLESRGVPTHAAERLVALGFVDDVLERFPVPGALGWLRGQLVAKLGSAGFSGSEGRPLPPTEALAGDGH